MNTYIPVTIIRHSRERRSKCSLTPLEGREGIRFLRATAGLCFDMSGHTVLGLDAPELSEADQGRPILLLDSTWRLLPQLERCLLGEGVRRSLPYVETAYPRVSKLKADPLGGLASVEALFFARYLIGKRDDSLLDEYHWKDVFLENMRHAGFLLD